MAKKKSRTKYTSKGERQSTNQKTLNAMRSDRPLGIEHINKFDAFLKGKNVMFTIPNPNNKETNKRFIKVSGKDLYGDYRKYKTYSIIRDRKQKKA